MKMLLPNIKNFAKFDFAKNLIYSSTFRCFFSSAATAKLLPPRLYADVNKNNPAEYSDYENYDIKWG